jgi:hypothetical protein
VFRHSRTSRERRRRPIHPLQYPRWASAIAQGVPSAKVEPMARDGVGVQMCYRRVCGSTPGDWDSDNAVFAISLRRCRTTAYTSSAVPRFTNMLLSPRPFGSRSVVRLGVMNPELRPPLVAIPSVRDTAHAFTALRFPVGLWTPEGQMRRCRRRGAPVPKDRHLLSSLYPLTSFLTGFS